MNPRDVLYNKTYLFIILIFLLSFLIRTTPLLQGYNVPYGWVDTSSHISLALDFSSGDYDSLIHPWWHLRNHYIVNGYDIVDRNAASFFYPPFLTIILSVGFVFIHPGMAAIIIISLLYSLSVVSVFLLCRSFKMNDSYSLLSAVLAAFSIPLMQSQNHGFWTFAIALNFLIMSYAFLRMGKTKAAIASAFLSAITHWMFVVPIVIISILEYKEGGECGIRYIKYSSLILLPFYVFLAITWNPMFYVTTHLNELFQFNYMLAAIAGASVLLFWRKYKIVSISTAVIMFLSLLFYIPNFIFPFGDMLQFTYPYIIAFFVAAFFKEMFSKRTKKHIFRNIKFKHVGVVVLTITFLLVAYNLLIIHSMFKEKGPSITNTQFDALLGIRESSIDRNVILMIDKNLSPWITISSKENPILYVFGYEGEEMVKYYKNYIINETIKEGLRLYEIDTDNKTLKERTFDIVNRIPRIRQDVN